MLSPCDGEISEARTIVFRLKAKLRFDVARRVEAVGRARHWTRDCRRRDMLMFA
jgi:hypothetical protein